MANDKLQLPAGATLVEDEQQNTNAPDLPPGSTLVDNQEGTSNPPAAHTNDELPPTKVGTMPRGSEVWKAINEPLIPEGRAEREGHEISESAPSRWDEAHPTLSGIKKGAAGAYADTMGFVRGLSSPLGIATLGLGEMGEAPGAVGRLAKIGSRVAGAGFGVQGAEQTVKGAQDIAADGITPENVNETLNGLGTAAMGGAATVHGTKIGTEPINESVKKMATAPVRAVANKVPAAPAAMKEFGLPGHERTATKLVGNDYLPKAAAPTPAAPPASPLGRIEYGEPTTGRAVGLAGNDYTEGAAATAPVREPNPLGRIEYTQPTLAVDQPITPAEVQSSPGTSMSKPAQELLKNILGKDEIAPSAKQAALSEPAQDHLNKILGEPTVKPRTPGEPLEHGFNMKPAEDLGNAAREGAEKQQGTISRERRERFRTPDEIQTQKLFKQARTELGEDASSDDVMKRVDELKSTDINPRVGNNTTEAAKADNDYFAQAKKEKGPNASISEVATKAQELKDAAKSAPKAEEKETVRQPLGKLEKSKGVPEVADLVNKYNESKGRGAVEAPKSEAHTRGKEIADAYDAMEHNPSDPKVKASYDSLKKTLDEQWDHAVDNGYKFDASEKDPYKNSKEMREDVSKNKHLSFFKTSPDSLPEDHPMAEVDPKTGLTYNDKFRAVHDLYGHAAHGNEFGPGGEEAAFKAHAATMPKEAIPALASETRGQNNWFNFGKHLRNAAGEIPAKGEEGYTEPKARPFAKGKAGLLPDEFHSDEAATDHADAIAKLHNAGGGSTYNPIKGDMGGKDAYAVPMHPELSKTVEGESVTPEQIKKYMEDPKVKAALAADPSLSVGTWAHDGKTFLDLSSTITDRDEAVALGKKNNQKAITYLKTREDIPTGGNGTGTPLEEKEATKSDRFTPEQVAEMKKLGMTEQEIEQLNKKSSEKPKETITANGSAPGAEGAGSVEAINRQASEKNAGTKRIKILKNGQEVPLIGPDAVDAVAGKGETIVKRYADGHEEVQDQGAGANYRGPSGRAPHTELTDLEQEAYHPVVEEQVSNLDNESLKKLGKSYGLDPDQYNFQKREPLREGGSKHPVERIKFVKDLMAALPDDEKQNIGRAAEELKRNPGTFSNADKSQASRAAAAKSLFPKLREETPAEENKETVRVPLGKLEAKGPAPKATAETAKMSDKELLKAGFTQEDIDAGLHLPKIKGGAAGAAVAPAKEGPISKQLLKTYGKTDDPLTAGFVLPNGDMVKLQGEHDTMVKAAAEKLGLKGKSDRESVINKENAVRTRLVKTRAGDELVFSIPEHVTEEQMQKMRSAVSKMGRYGNVAIEQGKAGGEHFRKEFALPSHIDEGIKQLGAEPVAEPSPIPEDIAQKMPPHELESVTKSPRTTERFLENMESIPSVQEYTDIALAGEGAKKWYQRSAAAFDAMKEEAPDYFSKEGDKDRFLGLLAASSPRQSVAMNLREALGAWKSYVDAGRPEGEELKTLLKNNFTASGGKVPNAMKALAGEDTWPDLTKNQNFKVPSFEKNLKGWLNYVTNDGWMALFGGLDPRQISDAHSYHPLSVATRAAAEALGWEPAEAQAAIWSFTQALTERGEELPEEIRKQSEDFADIMAHDELVRGLLEDLGVKHEQLDAKLKAIGEKPPVSGRTTATTSRSVGKLKERIEEARGKGAVPPPKSAQGSFGFRENPAHEGRVKSKDTEFNPEEFEMKELGSNKEDWKPAGIEKGIPHSEPVKVTVPISDIDINKHSLDKAQTNTLMKRGSKTSGPINLFYDTHAKQVLVEDGHHRLGDAIARGDKTVPATIWSGYSDYIPTVSKEDRFSMNDLGDKESPLGRAKKRK